jgi:hypothetical protein
MNDEYELVENAPSASRVAESLRDTGYDFNVAIADVVDNSIDAKATEVHISIAFDEDYKLTLSIADNGSGMDSDGITNALKYGAEDLEVNDRLGKFGLGLKTASTAFCRRLEVISRPSADSPTFFGALDLDQIAKSNKWVNQKRAANVFEKQLLDDFVGDSSGTVIVWAQIDRLLTGYQELGGKPRQKALTKLIEDLTRHLSMVFQRFLDRDCVAAPNLSIFINDEELAPWNPFYLGEATEVKIETLEIHKGDGSIANLVVEAYVLPRKEDFSSAELAESAMVGNDMQGVYVFRENRLIHGPDWLGIFKMEPHYALARVGLYFDHDLDEGFHVDIKKSRIILDSALQDMLKTQFFNPARALAEQRRRKGQPPRPPVSIHSGANTVIDGKKSVLTMANVQGQDEIGQTADITNNGGTQKVPLRIVRREGEPSVWVDTAVTLEDGVLWTPSFNEGKLGVTLNQGHPYYQKAYLPNSGNSNFIQALDYLLWSVAQAELNNMEPQNKDAFSEFRVEVSRNLKKLVESLPAVADDE